MRRVYAEKQSTIAEVIYVVKQFAAESCEDVALDVLKGARLSLDVNGGIASTSRGSASKDK